MIGIYKITSPSGKVYVGQSKDIEKRISKYKTYSGCKKQIHLYNSLKKYGSKNHVYEVCHELPIDVPDIILDNYEILYMDLYESAGIELLNMIAGGQGKNRGVGRKMTEENKEALRIRMTGNTYSFGNKNACGKRKQEHKDTRKELWKKGTYNCNLIPIICNETKEEYPSIKAASISLGLPGKSGAMAISVHLRGKGYKSGINGLTFSYNKQNKINKNAKQ